MRESCIFEPTLIKRDSNIFRLMSGLRRVEGSGLFEVTHLAYARTQKTGYGTLGVSEKIRRRYVAFFLFVLFSFCGIMYFRVALCPERIKENDSILRKNHEKKVFRRFLWQLMTTR